MPVARRQHVVFDCSARCAQQVRQPCGFLRRHDRILRSGHDEHRFGGEIDLRRRAERHHCTQQDRARQHLRAQQQHGRRDVGAVRITKRRGGGDAVLRARTFDEYGELISTPPDVVLIENALSEPAEEARHAVLQHLAARRKQRRIRGNRAAKREEIVFVTAGAVQKEEWCRSWPCARLEAVNERQRGHHANASIGGNAASISLLRGSRKPGSFNELPSKSTGSSIAKPGMSVAISNRTPPGSRK